MTRKRTLVFALLAMLVLSAQIACAQPITVFGNIGYGSLSTSQSKAEDGSEKSTSSTSAQAVQLGFVYKLPSNLGVGGVFDRVHAAWTQESTVSGEATEAGALRFANTLTGYGVILSYELPTTSFDAEAFAGAVRYSLESSLAIESGLLDGETRRETDPAVGIIGGANVKAPLMDRLHLTGAFAYRSVSFDKGTMTYSSDGQSESEKSDLSLKANGWNLSGGLAFKF